MRESTCSYPALTVNGTGMRVLVPRWCGAAGAGCGSGRVRLGRDYGGAATVAAADGGA